MEQRNAFIVDEFYISPEVFMRVITSFRIKI